MKKFFKSFLLIICLSVNILFFQNCSVGSSSGGNPNLNQNPNSLLSSNKIKLFAGSYGGSGYFDGNAVDSFFSNIQSIAVDSQGNVIVADTYNHVIRKMSKGGVVTTIAGKNYGFADGVGTAAKFNSPTGIFIDKNDDIFIADTGNYSIRKLTKDGSVSTIIGRTSYPGTAPRKLVVDSIGNIFVLDSSSVIKKILPDKTLINYCGSGGYGLLDGSCIAALFNASPQGLAIDKNNNLYVSESNSVIRKISSDGVVSTIAGSSAKTGYDNTGLGLFNIPKGLKVDGVGNIYVVDSGNNCVRKISVDGKISTYTGNPNLLVYSDGGPDQAQFKNPADLAIDSSGVLYVADEWNYTIRQVSTSGDVKTIAGVTPSYAAMDGSLLNAHFFNPSEFIFDNEENIILADSANNCIRKIFSTGAVTTLSGICGKVGLIDGPAQTALFNYPTSVAVDSKGNIFVADRYSHTIRKIAKDGSVSTVAGKAMIPSFADGTGLNARFNEPSSLVIDKKDNLYIADYANNIIRKIDVAGNVTTFAGVAGGGGSIDGIGANARLSGPTGLAMTSSGQIVVACADGVIKLVTSDAAVTTIAGFSGFSGSDNGIGNKARFNLPSHVAVDKDDNIFISDYGNSTIRMITKGGQVSTIVGTVDLRYNLLDSLPSVILPVRGLAVKNKTLYMSSNGGLLSVDLPN